MQLAGEGYDSPTPVGTPLILGRSQSSLATATRRNFSNAHILL